MLKKVKIENFYSISEAIELDFTRGNYEYRNNMIFENDLVNPIGIYGFNGSGKSNFLKAIYAVSKLMYHSNSSGNSNLFIPNLLVDGHIDPVSKISFIVCFDGIEYSYEIHVDIIDGIRYEKLKRISDNYVYFTRNDNDYSYNNIKKSVEGSNYPILRLIGKDQLEEGSEISQIFDFFENIIYIDADGDVFSDLTEKNDINELIVKHSENIKNIIKKYGEFPIYDLIYSKDFNGLKKSVFFKMEGSEVDLPYELASDGIKLHNKMLSTLLESQKKSLILVDEVEHNLHPLIAQKVVDNMNDMKIQMIFTSHNTNLLQRMRPDQIVFTRWKNNRSTYKKLSKLYPNIREINNIEKMYFGGLFDDE